MNIKIASEEIQLEYADMVQKMANTLLPFFYGRDIEEWLVNNVTESIVKSEDDHKDASKIAQQLIQLKFIKTADSDNQDFTNSYSTRYTFNADEVNKKNMKLIKKKTEIAIQRKSIISSHKRKQRRSIILSPTKKKKKNQ